MTSKTAPVAGELERRYSRLLALYPPSYRAAHGEEVLDHLLDDAGPEQRRPSSADRADIVKSIVREWCLAPLGPTASQRRAALSWLLALVPLVLALPAAASLRDFAITVSFSGSLLEAVSLVPLAPVWAVWALGAVLGGVGRWRGAGGVLCAAAGLMLAVVAWLALRGDSAAAFTAVGWLLAVGVHAGVSAERAEGGLPAPSVRWRRIGGLAVAVAVTFPLATVLQVLFVGAERTGQAIELNIGSLPAGVILLVAGALLALHPGGRQALPLMAGIGVAVMGGRLLLTGTGLPRITAPDLGNGLLLVAASLVSVILVRVLVNYLDVVRAPLRRETLSGP